jgi:hypothetical protein
VRADALLEASALFVLGARPGEVYKVDTVNFAFLQILLLYFITLRGKGEVDTVRGVFSPEEICAPPCAANDEELHKANHFRAK